MTITDDDEKEKDINGINYHLALHRFTVKLILRNFHHFQYTFFRPLHCDANPCKNGGTCVEVPSRKT